MKKSILFWLTDIRDEYILDAAAVSAGAQRGSGNILHFGAGIAGIAGIAAAAMLVVGGLALHFQNQNPQNVPPVTLGEPESSSEEETEESSGEENSSGSIEENSSAEESGESGSASGSQNRGENNWQSEMMSRNVVGNIPGMNADERLVICTDEESFIVVRPDGTVQMQFDNAKPYCENGYGEYAYRQLVQLVSTEEPLVIAVRPDGAEGNFGDRCRVGMYSLKENTWVIEPERTAMHVLSPSVCTDSDAKRCYGSLICTDGRLMCETDGSTHHDEDEGHHNEHHNMGTGTGQSVGQMPSATETYRTDGIYTRMGDYICDECNIYDLEGSYLYSVNGEVLGCIDKRIFCRDWSSKMTNIYDESGTIQGSMESYLASVCGDYINWKNGEEGCITDADLNRVLDDAQFLEKNPQLENGLCSICMVSVSPQGTECLIEAERKETGEKLYFRCDNGFHVLETYDLSRLSLRDPGTNADSAIERQGKFPTWEEEPVLWSRANNTLTVTTLWGGETITAPFSDEAELLSVAATGGIACAHYMENLGDCHLFMTKDSHYILDGDTLFVCGLEPDIVEVTCGYEGSSFRTSLYFRKDGTSLNGSGDSQVLYAADDFRCIEKSGVIFIEDYSGTCYGAFGPYKEATDLDYQGVKVYYYENGIISSPGKTLVKVGENEKLSSQFVLYGDRIYFTINSAEACRIIYLSLKDGTFTPVKQLSAESESEYGGDLNTCEILGCSGQKLIYRHGTWSNNKTFVLDMQSGEEVEMMSGAERLCGVWNNHYVFIANVTDVSPKGIEVYDGEGNLEFQTYSLYDCYVNGANLYFRDDSDYVAWINRNYEGWDPNVEYDPQNAALQIKSYSMETGEVRVIREYEKSGYIVEKEVDRNGLLYEWSLGGEWTAVPVLVSDAVPVTLSFWERPILANGRYYVIRQDAMYLLDFKTGSLKQICTLSDREGFMPPRGEASFVYMKPLASIAFRVFRTQYENIEESYIDYIASVEFGK